MTESPEIKVLYVDDEPALLELGKKFLELNHRCSVDTARSAEEAFSLLASGTYDAVVSDYQMPEMDGLAFLRILRERYPRLPFIIFTGKGREDIAIAAFNIGADFYLQKGGRSEPQFAELFRKISAAVEQRRTERALEESQKTLFGIIDFLPDATFAIDAKGTVIAWNKAVEAMTGIKKDAIMGTGDYGYALPFYGERRPILIDLILHFDEAFAAEHYSSVNREGDTLFSEARVSRLPGGGKRYLWFTASPLRAKDGSVRGAIESVRDITHFRMAEQALRESEERYRNVVEVQTEFICRFLPDGTHVFVNDAYCRYFGKRREEIIGCRFRPVVPGEDGKKIRAMLTGLTPENPVGRPLEHRVIFPDGSVRWQRWVDRAIYDTTGRLVEYQSVGRDVTDLKYAEHACRQTVLTQDAIFEYSGTAGVIVDEDLTIVQANSRFLLLTGYTAAELAGAMKITDLVAEEDLPAFLGVHARLLHDPAGVSRNFQVRLIGPAQTFHTCAVTVGRIPETKRTVLSFIDAGQP